MEGGGAQCAWYLDTLKQASCNRVKGMQKGPFSLWGAAQRDLRKNIVFLSPSELIFFYFDTIFLRMEAFPRMSSKHRSELTIFSLILIVTLFDPKGVGRSSPTPHKELRKRGKRMGGRPPPGFKSQNEAGYMNGSPTYPQDMNSEVRRGTCPL